MDFFLKEKNYANDNFSHHEINKTTRGKNFQTLEDIKRNNSKIDPVPIDNIREFLQETNTSFCSDDGRLPKDTQKLEKKIIKQQYLVNNNLFDPTDYFGGLDIATLDDHIGDQRLDDMLVYLPTEMEENETIPIQKPVVLTKKIDPPQPKAVNNSGALAKKDPNKAITTQYFELNKKQNLTTTTNSTQLTSNHQVKTTLNSEKPSPFSQKNRDIASPSQKMFQKINSLNSSHEFRQTTELSKRKLKKDWDNKENQNDKNEITQFEETSTSFISQKKNKRTGDGKSFSGTLTHSSQKSIGSFPIKNSSKVALQKTPSHHQHHHSFVNPIKSLNLTPSYNSEPQTKLSFETLSSTKQSNIKGTPTNLFKAKDGKNSRVITKSTERTKDMTNNSGRSRNAQKNFSSFTGGTLSTEEEAELIIKSYCNNTHSRPLTANLASIEGSNSVLKGMLSPKIENKSVIPKNVTNAPEVKCEKEREEKPQTPNSLKFLNDLLNKRKISCGSSDHLRMPKKPSFLGKKPENHQAQIVHKQFKNLIKSETLESKVVNKSMGRTPNPQKSYAPSPHPIKKSFY